jgi:hypothetical protein
MADVKIFMQIRRCLITRVRELIRSESYAKTSTVRDCLGPKYA